LYDPATENASNLLLLKRGGDAQRQTKPAPDQLTQVLLKGQAIISS